MARNLSLLFIVLTLITTSTLTAQSFDIQRYQEFMNSNKNLSPQQLLSKHSSPLFASKVQTKSLNAEFLDSVISKYKLTRDELDIISQQGFVVTERLEFPTFGEAFMDIYRKDLPVFISTDAILHALHKSYDEILKTTEKYLLNDLLEKALLGMYDSFSSLELHYGTNPLMHQMLNDVDVYITVALKLIGIEKNTHRFENTSYVKTIMDAVKTEQPANINLFGEKGRLVDFSQFTPRGHYDGDVLLQDYFRAMMWLGRIELMFSKPVTPGIPVPSDADIQRQTIDAFLIHELDQQDSTKQRIAEIDRVIKFLVGESDNVTLSHLDMLKSEANIKNAEALLDKNTLERFQSTLRIKSYAVQRILSQILMRDPYSPTTVQPPSAFLLLGQRFVIDSYVMGNVLYDKIDYNGTKVFRGMPSCLDPLFAMGNNASAQLLQNELSQYHYAPNLAGIRYLIDSYEEEFWKSTLYNTWLQSIRTLNPPSDLSSYPEFMRTGAWWQEKINTQLASWAQLRHDNILYAKQSYTPWGTCTFPHSYVEPYPELYRTLSTFAQRASEFYRSVSFVQSSTQLQISTYFDHFSMIVDTLRRIALKELSNSALSPDEETFLKDMLFIKQGCGYTVSTGWYARLFYESAPDTKEYIIADVHTQPADEGGNPVGYVLHVGTGRINIGILTAPCEDKTLTAFVGPMLSYFEHVTMNFKRLTDKEWGGLYDKPEAIRPSWVNVYLTDKNGNRRTNGLKLITDEPLSVQTKNEASSHSIIGAQCYPNPFGAINSTSTLIQFSITDDQTAIPVNLIVYDVTGRKIRDLSQSNLTRGSYYLRWDGKNNQGESVSNGLYFCHVKVGGELRVLKMIVAK